MTPETEAAHRTCPDCAHTAMHSCGECPTCPEWHQKPARPPDAIECVMCGGAGYLVNQTAAIEDALGRGFQLRAIEREAARLAAPSAPSSGDRNARALETLRRFREEGDPDEQAETLAAIEAESAPSSGDLPELRALYNPNAESRVAPNVPGCECVADPADDEAGEPVLCPYHEARLRKLRWSTLALMVIDYEALIHATSKALDPVDR